MTENLLSFERPGLLGRLLYLKELEYFRYHTICQNLSHGFLQFATVLRKSIAVQQILSDYIQFNEETVTPENSSILAFLISNRQLFQKFDAQNHPLIG